MLCSVIVGARRAVLVVLVAVLAAVGTQTTSFAANTEVHTTICSGVSSNASLVIDTPTSDSIIDQLPLTISGTSTSITQIDITVDGQYNSTVPIDANQSSFSTSLQLSQGTHTIELEGNDVCQYQNVTETLVVTYQPQATPSQGGATPTTTPGVTPSTSDSTPSGSVDTGATPLEELPIVGPVVPVIRDLARSIDLDATARQDGMFVAMMRFALFVAGIVLVFFGPVILRAMRKNTMSRDAVKGYVYGAASKLQDPRLREHIRRNTGIIEGLGSLMLLLAFVI